MTKNTDFVDSFVTTVRSVVGFDSEVSLHEPDITDVEKQLINECLDSTFVSSVGKFVTLFESKISEFTGAKYAVAVNSGTSALQIALQIAGVERGSEVLVPALSFVATANAVHHAGAHPHFVDIDPLTLGMSVDATRNILESMESRDGKLFNPDSGRRLSAIIPMHTLGHPVEISNLLDLADDFNLAVVEDAAESLGSFVGAQHTGTFGKLGILSFNGNKIITTGGGGMILTDDPELATKAKHVTTTAKINHPWRFFHDEIGWNYRLPNLNAALGVAQLSRLPQFLLQKRKLSTSYAEAFHRLPGADFIQEPEGTRSNYWLCSVMLDEMHASDRDKILQTLNEQGIHARPLWDLLSTLPMYRRSPSGSLENAKSVQERVISLPSSPNLVNAVSSAVDL